MRNQADAQWAVDRYQAIAGRFPQARFPDMSRTVNSLSDIVESFDAFVFDSFGVLNVGDSQIPGAAACIRYLRSIGKRTIVLTNASSVSVADYHCKLLDLGFDFAPQEIVSSRTVLSEALSARLGDVPWACIARQDDNFSDLPVPCVRYDKRSLDDVAGILFLASPHWSNADNDDLIGFLKRRPIPILIGNPDLVAPFEEGFSIQPGSFAHEIADCSDVRPEFFGKPFSNAFDAVKARLDGVSPDRVMMLGDTLHTDILGGAAAGFQTGLVTGFGLLKDLDVAACIADSGIVPDYILPSIG